MQSEQLPAGALKGQLYLQPKTAVGAHAPKAAKKYVQAQQAAALVSASTRPRHHTCNMHITRLTGARPCTQAHNRCCLTLKCLQNASRSLPPLEAVAGREKAQQIRTTLNTLGSKVCPPCLTMNRECTCAAVPGVLLTGVARHGCVCTMCAAASLPHPQHPTHASSTAPQASALRSLKDTPGSPKTDVPPLSKVSASQPPLRGSGRRAGEDASPQAASGAGGGPRRRAAEV